MGGEALDGGQLQRENAAVAFAFVAATLSAVGRGKRRANGCKDSDRVCVWVRASVGNVLGSGLGDAGGSSGAVDSGYGVADESLLRVLRAIENLQRECM